MSKTKQNLLFWLAPSWWCWSDACRLSGNDAKEVSCLLSVSQAARESLASFRAPGPCGRSLHLPVRSPPSALLLLSRVFLRRALPWSNRRPRDFWLSQLRKGFTVIVARPMFLGFSQGSGPKKAPRQVMSPLFWFPQCRDKVSRHAGKKIGP